MKLPAVEQFPLNFITRLQPDGDGQGQREAHIQAGILSARTDRLNSQRISGLHFFLMRRSFFCCLCEARVYSSSMSSRIIPFPTELRPRLPTILGNVDYLTFREGLEQLDR